MSASERSWDISGNVAESSALSYIPSLAYKPLKMACGQQETLHSG